MENKNSFELKIVTPKSEEIIFVEWLDVKTVTGNFFVGPGHDDLIAILKEREQFSYKKSGEISPKLVDAYGGFLKIENSAALIVIDL